MARFHPDRSTAAVFVIRTHEALLALIRDFARTGAVEQLGEIDRTLFDLYDLHARILTLANIGALMEHSRACDEIAEIIRSETGSKTSDPEDRP